VGERKQYIWRDFVEVVTNSIGFFFFFFFFFAFLYDKIDGLFCKFMG
jgi:hypothetical protein